ncbi:hypothetical protein AMAG_17510 [Allomyces macrogynus ATCC 38327]|uniref:Uncharacterized protein n=1 Tax=Allomyces macrogynus (strain ATCC 38327) TaxID=578462 RepID=A0A0L0TFH3_ALLM3|nr:hypothetical protein AMAG_17510 [Allomyces macrogynus ATCC 38327]|eukprot:KNE73359.1 hypothetical protein AMAG_17510 [Allomyces macrogynus ATCC 38327]
MATSTTTAQVTKIVDRLTLQDICVCAIAHARTTNATTLRSWTLDTTSSLRTRRRQVDLLIDLLAGADNLFVNMFQPAVNGARLPGSPGVQVKRHGQLQTVQAAGSILGSRAIGWRK